MKLVTLVLLVVLAVGARAQQLQHDVSVDSVLALKGRPLAVYTAQIVWVTNRGTDTERNVPVVCITTSNQQIVYRDTMFVSMLAPGATQIVRFADFLPLFLGNYQTCGIAMLAGDQNTSNDTHCQIGHVGYSREVQMLSVVIPKQNDSIAYGTSFQPRGQLRNIGVADLYMVPIRCEIRSTFTGTLYFRADTTIEAVDADSSIVSAVFPSHEGLYDTKRIPPGQYRASAIVRQPGDGDPSDDTAYSTFTIYANHDVGIDSMITADTFATGFAAPLRVRVTNHGVSGEPYLHIALTVSHNGVTDFADTIDITNMYRGETRDVNFGSFVPTEIATYQLCAASVAFVDDDPRNDTKCISRASLHSHDVRVLSLGLPDLVSATKGDTIPIAADVYDGGLRTELNVPVACTITVDGQEVYHDTVHVSRLDRFDTVTVHFKPYVLTNAHPFGICVRTLLAADEDASNDVICQMEGVSSYADVEMLLISDPKPGDTVAQPFKTTAVLHNIGNTTIDDVLLTETIRKYGDANVVMEIPSTIWYIYPDIPPTYYTMPSSKAYGVLAPGHYSMMIVSQAQQDDLAKNDTAYSDFYALAQDQSQVLEPLSATLHASIESQQGGHVLLSVTSSEPRLVTIDVFDMIGRKLASSDVQIPSGEFRVPVDLGGVAHGRYVARLRSNGDAVTVPFGILR